MYALATPFGGYSNKTSPICYARRDQKRVPPAQVHFVLLLDALHRLRAALLVLLVVPCCHLHRCLPDLLLVLLVAVLVLVLLALFGRAHVHALLYGLGTTLAHLAKLLDANAVGVLILSIELSVVLVVLGLDPLPQDRENDRRRLRLVGRDDFGRKFRLHIGPVWHAVFMKIQ